MWGATVVLALAFMSLIVGAPLARAHGQGTFAFMAYSAFAGLCHQLPERSFYLAGYPLAVCARCFGIYAGFTLGLLLYPLVRSLRDESVPARAWLVVAALPTAVDFTLGITGVWANTHTSRALTGAFLGAGAVFYIMPGLCALGRSYRSHLPLQAQAGAGR